MTNDETMVELMSDVLTHEYIHEITQSGELGREFTDWAADAGFKGLTSRYKSGQESLVE